MFPLNYYLAAASKTKNNFFWMTSFWLKRPMPPFNYTAHLDQTDPVLTQHEALQIMHTQHDCCVNVISMNLCVLPMRYLKRC